VGQPRPIHSAAPRSFSRARFIRSRHGQARGRIELRQTLTHAQDLWGYLFSTAILLVVTVFMRQATVPGTDFSLGTRTLPSVLGMGIAFGALVNMAQQLTIEREDGTLLRAKAIPNGMLGYLVGKILTVSGMVLIGVVLQLTPGLFLLDGLSVTSVGGWLTFAWVVLLGLVACLPLGAISGRWRVS
jgi:ABC-2 type transport system permease protein